ncbi:MAG: hypothetical protein ACREDE_06155, partial [Thermoplasmata archaeon]
SKAALLAEYERRLTTSNVIADFRGFARMDRLKWNPRYYTVYPKFAAELFRGMFSDRGEPKRPMRALLKRAQRAAGVATTTLVRDGVDLYRDL